MSIFLNKLQTNTDSSLFFNKEGYISLDELGQNKICTTSENCNFMTNIKGTIWNVNESDITTIDAKIKRTIKVQNKIITSKLQWNNKTQIPLITYLDNKPNINIKVSNLTLKSIDSTKDILFFPENKVGIQTKQIIIDSSQGNIYWKPSPTSFDITLIDKDICAEKFVLGDERTKWELNNVKWNINNNLYDYSKILETYWVQYPNWISTNNVPYSKEYSYKDDKLGISKQWKDFFPQIPFELTVAGYRPYISNATNINLDDLNGQGGYLGTTDDREYLISLPTFTEQDLMSLKFSTIVQYDNFIYKNKLYQSNNVLDENLQALGDFNKEPSNWNTMKLIEKEKTLFIDKYTNDINWSERDTWSTENINRTKRARYFPIPLYKNKQEVTEINNNIKYIIYTQNAQHWKTAGKNGELNVQNLFKPGKNAYNVIKENIYRLGFIAVGPGQDGYVDRISPEKKYGGFSSTTIIGFLFFNDEKNKGTQYTIDSSYSTSNTYFRIDSKQDNISQYISFDKPQVSESDSSKLKWNGLSFNSHNEDNLPAPDLNDDAVKGQEEILLHFNYFFNPFFILACFNGLPGGFIDDRWPNETKKLPESWIGTVFHTRAKDEKRKYLEKVTFTQDAELGTWEQSWYHFGLAGGTSIFGKGAFNKTSAGYGAGGATPYGTDDYGESQEYIKGGRGAMKIFY